MPSYHKVQVDRRCSVCNVRGRLHHVVTIRTGEGLSFRISDPEYRCRTHHFYVRCSFCRHYFDGTTVTFDSVVNHGLKLCVKHRDLKFCINCGRWRMNRACKETNNEMGTSAPKVSQCHCQLTRIETDTEPHLTDFSSICNPYPS